MKRIISVLLMIVLLMAGFAAAAEIDYASMSEEELNRVVLDASTELAERKGYELLFEECGLSFYVTGDYKFWDDADEEFLELNVCLINRGGYCYDLYASEIFINGESLYSGTSIWDIEPGTVRYDVLYIDVYRAQITEMDMIQEIAVRFEIEDAESYEKYGEVELAKVYFDGKEFVLNQSVEPTAGAAAAEKADTAVTGMQRVEAATGVYSLEVPEDYIVLGKEALEELRTNVDQDDMADILQSTGYDRDVAEMEVDAWRTREISEDDLYIIASNLIGNITIEKREGFPIPKKLFPFAEEMMRTMFENEMPGSINVKGMTLIGENYFFGVGIVVENIASQSQYLTVDSNGNLIGFAFTNIDEDVTKTILESVRIN